MARRQQKTRGAEHDRSLRPTQSRVLAARGALPAHRYAQHELTDTFAEAVGATSGSQHALLHRLHANSGVDHRHLALPKEAYAALPDFGTANDAFIVGAVDLGSRAMLDALAAVGRTPQDVDLVAVATVTGIAVPTLDARIAALTGMRPDVKRMPLVGLGCVAGAAGVARVHDYLLGHPGDVAVLICVELCSLTLQRDDLSTANLVASGLFGDGAAAVVMVGADVEVETPAGASSTHSSGPAVLATRSRMYADTERAMGWDIGSTGLRIVLGVEVPELVRAQVRDDVDGFLAGEGLTRCDISWWVAHPGGPKVLQALQQALEVPREALEVTWRSLAEIGNLSSASVLHVLADTLRERPPERGSLGLMLAMGPGFCLEMVLLRAAE